MKARPLSAIVIAATTMIVIALGVLQYRWSNQVSEATSIRLADSLQMSMINWHFDFFRDFSEICFTLGGPDSDSRNEYDSYARRLAEWKRATAYPDLVSSLYIVKWNGAARPALLKLNPARRAFEAVAWPARFADVRARMEEISSGAEPARSPGVIRRSEAPSAAAPEAAGQEGDRFYPASPLAAWRFEPAIPALLRPIAYDERGFSTQPPPGKGEDWILVELSRRVIGERILPDLANRYFQGTEGLDYQVAMTAGSAVPPGTRTVLYTSDSNFGQVEVKDADGTMDLFGRSQGDGGSPIRIFHAASESTGLAASAGLSWFPLFREIPLNQDWQLVVRHRRGGALGAFVADMRRRNLAISFGVLFLLVVCLAMLIIVSSRAQRLAKLQMDFVTAVSHELRTPLTVISSAADNIAHGVVEGKDQLKQYGSVIGGQARRLFGLVEQILLFAQIREGHQRYTLRQIEVIEVIDAALAGTGSLVEEARFIVSKEIPASLPPIIGDLPALSRCVQNLITNALKYGGEARWIGIRVQVQERGPGGKEIQISVSDRGMGIAAEDLPHIFEPFYRSSTVAAAQIHGTGLGLTLAKSIAEGMNGRLTVASVPERGSTFTLHLPLATRLSEAASMKAREQVPS